MHRPRKPTPAGVRRARAGGYSEMIAQQAANAFHPDSLADASLMAARSAMVADYGAERFIAHTEAVMARPDRQSLLTGDIPTLVVAASHDKVFPPSSVTGFGAAIPGATVACIEGAGHLAPMERPQALADTLRAWMNA